MKTFEQCCDEVAKIHKCKDWNEMYNLYKDNARGVYFMQLRLAEAAELYRLEGIKEAVKLARSRNTAGYGFVYRYTEQEIIDKLTK